VRAAPPKIRNTKNFEQKSQNTCPKNGPWLKYNNKFQTVAIPITAKIDGQVELDTCAPKVKKSLKVSIVIPALEPSIVICSEKDTSSQISTPKSKSSD